MNVRINLGGLKDEAVKASLRDRLQKISSESESEFQRIDRIVQSKLG
jgi:formiminotetrahydrofolate cyclodeaminase